ncbi:hypothetical protein AVEN_102440-1 [Araneus ventricosus]|uniref:Uncharacterized protein n=1 Tax=Araneus ventricosus TaxID=182803 RepID=A0A4Y2LP68_ARAVE|nr:hypothetical protein AVEN_102440-1 [Araneus ventricosus]
MQVFLDLVTKLYSCFPNMLILGQEREFYRGFTGSQTNELRPWRPFWRLSNKVGAFGDKTNLLEFWSYLYYEWKYPEPSRVSYVTSLPVGKGMKKEALKPRLSLFDFGQQCKMVIS